MKAKTIAIVTLLISIGLFGLAQTAGWINWLGEMPGREYDGKEEFKKLYNRYNGSGNFDITGTILLYDVENNNALKEQTSYRSARAGNNLYTQLGCQKTYVVDGLIVQLDTLQKFIIVSALDQQLQEQNASPAFPLESFLNNTSVFSINATVTDNGKDRILKLDGDAMPQVKAAFIYYDPADYSIQKAEIEWWKDQGISERPDAKKCWLSQVRYARPGKAIPDISGELEKILSIRDGNVVVNAPYQGYELVVNL